MKILELNVKNFRQFYEPQQIQFANDDQNVTLLVGVNGTGKTGIFRAIIYALYGQRELAQDTNKTGIHLVNFTRLEENKDNPVVAEVTLKFENEQQEYLLTRTIIEVKDEDGIHELSEGATLSQVSETGELNKRFDSPDQVTDFVSQILPPRIKNFFLFDAERLQLLNKLSHEKNESNQIKTGIRDFLQISTLTRAKKNLETLYRSQMNEITKLAGDSKIEELTANIDQLNQKIIEINARSETAHRAGEDAQQELDSLKKEIDQNRDLQDEKTYIDNQQVIKDSAEKNISVIYNNLVQDTEAVTSVLAADVFEQVMPKVKAVREEQRDVFSKQVLKRSIQNGKCLLCGSDLNKDEKAMEHIKSLLNQYQSSELSGVLDLIERSRDRITEDADKLPSKTNQNYQDLVDASEKAEYAQANIDRKSGNIQEELGMLENLKEKERHTLPTLRDKIAKCQVQIQSNDEKIQQIQQEIEEQEKIREEKIAENSKLAMRQKVADRTKRIADELSATLTKYDRETREKLAVEVKNMFNQLITEKDQHLIKQVTISANYEMQVLGDNDVDLLNDISMGQSQVLSLAFIFALAKLASKGRSEMNFPLFIDTPFARLDSEIRDHIIKVTPSLASQWVLLLTDTEFTGREKESFIKGGRVGSTYQIQKAANGKSQITELTFDEKLGE